MKYKIIGCPVSCGQKKQGSELGPKFLRYFGIENQEFIIDGGDVEEPIFNKNETSMYDEKVHKPDEVLGWTRSILNEGLKTFAENNIPVFLGGDHSIAMGSVLSASINANNLNRPLYVLWIDAHSDINSLESSDSGNMHGMPLNYLTGKSDFPNFPEVAQVDDSNIMMMGIRSVDDEEAKIINESNITFCNMKSVNDGSAYKILDKFLKDVVVNNGILHVSFDLDFLDPELMPGTGTAVEDGGTIEQVEEIFKMVMNNMHILGSLDIVELNPLLDSKNQSLKTIKKMKINLRKAIADECNRRNILKNTAENCIA